MGGLRVFRGVIEGVSGIRTVYWEERIWILKQKESKYLVGEEGPFSDSGGGRGWCWEGRCNFHKVLCPFSSSHACLDTYSLDAHQVFHH